jgi:hypothetical protein
LLPLAPQVSQVGNSALMEREAVTLPLDHAFGFELPSVGPAAIEVQRQGGCAGGRGRGGSPSSTAALAPGGRSSAAGSVSCSFLFPRDSLLPRSAA